jgi:hypothetical protein
MPPGGYPIAVKYIIDHISSYHIIYYIISLRKDHSLRIFENRALRERFEPEGRE